MEDGRRIVGPYAGQLSETGYLRFATPLPTTMNASNRDHRNLTAARLGPDRTLEQLVAIDRPGNRIRVVVNVFQLSEGWDVTNVYVVAPLRAMVTFQNAVQTMGRGLRLPFGTRAGEPEVDTFDVLCFGKEPFERIVEFDGQVSGRV